MRKSSQLRLATGAVALAVTALIAAGCSSSGSSGGSASGASSAMTTVTIGTSGATAAYGPVYVGVQQGIFAKYGLNVKLQTLTPSSVTAAVLSGNIDVAFDGPNLASGILKQPSAKIMATTGPNAFYIYAKKGITSVAGLKGKTIAVTTPGGSIDTAVRKAIAADGLTPGTDVKIAYLQTNSAALAAVETGSVQAAGVSPPTSVQAQQAGLVDVENITQYCPLGLTAISNSFAANKSVMQKFFAAWKAANKLAVSSNADSNEALKTYVKLTDTAQLNGSWQAYKSLWVVAPYPASAMKQVFEGLAKANPPVAKAATADPASIIDNSFVSASG